MAVWPEKANDVCIIPMLLAMQKSPLYSSWVAAQTPHSWSASPRRCSRTQPRAVPPHSPEVRQKAAASRCSWVMTACRGLQRLTVLHPYTMLLSSKTHQVGPGIRFCVLLQVQRWSWLDMGSLGTRLFTVPLPADTGFHITAPNATLLIHHKFA